ncbi:MAG: O-methyltransferase [bacterium]
MNSYINSPSILDYLVNKRHSIDSLIKEMEEYALVNKIPILNWKAVELLELLIVLKQPEAILEIGTAIGYSSIRMARKLNHNVCLDTIEKSKNNLPIAQGFINKAGLADKINILFGEAEDIMRDSTKMYDFIFLDADKLYYQSLFHLSLKLLKPGGLFFVDNLLWKGYVADENVPDNFVNSTKLVKDFNTLFLNNPHMDSKIFPIGDGVGIAIKRG